MTANKPKSPEELAHEYRLNGDPTAWFELIYAASDTRGSGVPWAKMSPNQYLLKWLDQTDAPVNGKSVLVVGCGLGDDAEELARRGYAVTAFDISASAIKLCQQRFPKSLVQYQVADLFNTSKAWQAAFDLVFENITVQALPPDMQVRAIQQITPLAAPNGQIFVISLVRDPQHEPNGPPWPLSRDSLKYYVIDGRREIFLNSQPMQFNSLIAYIQALYAR